MLRDSPFRLDDFQAQTYGDIFLSLQLKASWVNTMRLKPSYVSLEFCNEEEFTTKRLGWYQMPLEWTSSYVCEYGRIIAYNVI